ncbi:MAG: flagellar hook-length control protein FliK [Firmicutes bacterium]|nr:flagellar hook-length control protein FliK [Bacillota bacterium]
MNTIKDLSACFFELLPMNITDGETLTSGFEELVQQMLENGAKSAKTEGCAKTTIIISDTEKKAPTFPTKRCKSDLTDNDCEEVQEKDISPNYSEVFLPPIQIMPLQNIVDEKIKAEEQEDTAILPRQLKTELTSNSYEFLTVKDEDIVENTALMADRPTNSKLGATMHDKQSYETEKTFILQNTDISGEKATNREKGTKSNTTAKHAQHLLQKSLKTQLRATGAAPASLEEGNAAVINEKADQGNKNDAIDFNFFDASPVGDNDTLQMPEQADEMGKVLKSSLVKSVSFLKEGSKQKLEVTLKPDTLGKMVIKLQNDGGGIKVKISTASQTIKELLMAQAEQIQESIKGQGVDVKGVEVFYSGMHSNSNFKGENRYKAPSKKSAGAAKVQYEQSAHNASQSFDEPPININGSVNYLI